MRFLLSQGKLGIRISESESDPIDSYYEVAILSFSEILKASIRSEDLCARLGQLEFTLILKGSPEIATSLAERVLRSWNFDGFDCRYSVLEVDSGESSLEILNRLDNQELQSAT